MTELQRKTIDLSNRIDDIIIEFLDELGIKEGITTGEVLNELSNDSWLNVVNKIKELKGDTDEL